MKYFITGTRRGLGKALLDKYGTVNKLEDCDIFINCKHDGFNQVELLYQAAELGKQIINIGSHASDYTFNFKYAVEKKALREANHQLFSDGIKTTCINFGHIDTESQKDKEVKKMSLEYAVGIVDWVLQQPHSIKEITVVPQ
tara:strand:- start:1139 stop:1564 length:426 start_codon:yes stop_codon:yes gene_type:complete